MAASTARCAMPRPFSRSIVMAGLQCGEGEDALGHLVLGHHAEADRQTRFVCVSNSTSAGTGALPRPSRAARPLSATASGQPSSASPVSETAPARRGRGGSRRRAAAARTPCSPSSRHGRDRSARSARRGAPGRRRDPASPPFVRPDLLGERADRAAERVVELRRRPDRAPEGVGEGGGPLQCLLLEAQIGGHVLRASGSGSPRRAPPPAPCASPRSVPMRIARGRKREPTGPARVRPAPAPPPGPVAVEVPAESPGPRSNRDRHTRTAIRRQRRGRARAPPRPRSRQ